jgi:nucleoside-diphosphate-sugar epimerase
MKALIIGGTGNISRYVSALALERGWELWLLNRGKRPESVPEGAHLLRGDVHDEAAAKKLLGDMTFDSVSEFTAFTPKDAERDLRLFSGRTKQYIFISSATVYRKPPASYPVREGDSLGNPYWKYARDKIACEEILMREFRDSGFPVTIVRPSHTYGDGSITLCVHGSGGPWQIVKNIIDRKPVIVAGDGTTLWTVTHSEDFARGFVGLMGNTAAVGECLHLTSGEALTWNDIYDRVGAALGVEVEKVHISSDFLARVRPDLGGPLLGDKANCAVFDNSKLKRLVPDFCVKVPFDIGVRRTLKYMLDHPEIQTPDPEFDEFCDKVIAARNQAIASFTESENETWLL